MNNTLCRILLASCLIRAAGCAVPTGEPPLETITTEGAALTVKDSAAVFAGQLAAAGSALRPLADADLAFRTRSRELQAVLNQRNRLVDNTVTLTLLREGLKKRKGGAALARTTITAMARDVKKGRALAPALRSLGDRMASADAAFLAQLGTQQRKAREDLKRTGASAVHAAQVACFDWSHRLRKRLPSLHTEVATLRNQPRYGGDISQEGLLLDLCRKIASEDAGVPAAINLLQTQLAAMSTRQLRAFERVLVDEIDGAIARTAPVELAYAVERAAFAARFTQIAAVPVVLVADQTRHLRRYSKPGLSWVHRNRALLQRWALVPNSILERVGFFVYDPRRHLVVPISSKAMLAPANTKHFRGAWRSRYFKFADRRGGETTNGLAAFIDSLGQPCRAVDFVPAGRGAEVAESYACDPGCKDGAPSTTSATQREGWGLTGFAPAAGRAPAYRASTGSCAQAGQAGGGDGGNSARGSVGGMAGGYSQCLQAAVIAASAGLRGAELSCLGSVLPQTRAIGTMGQPTDGGRSCRPGVSDDVGGSGDGSNDPSTTEDDDETVVPMPGLGVDVDGDGKNDYESFVDNNGTPEDPDDDAWMFVPAGCSDPVDCPDETVIVTPEGMQDGSYKDSLKGDFCAQSPGDPGCGGGDSGGSDPPPATDPAASDPGRHTSQQDPGSIQFVSYDVWTDIWQFEVQSSHVDPDDDMCGINPQCREPDHDSLEDCMPDSASCDTGCTGNDTMVDDFVGCMTANARDALTGGHGVGPLDPYINPSPDSTSGFGAPAVDQVLACHGGHTPGREQCRGEGLAMCTEDRPNCMCDRPTGELPASLMGPDCEHAMCAADAATGELSAGTNEGLGACGCTSVLGG